MHSEMQITANLLTHDIDRKNCPVPLHLIGKNFSFWSLKSSTGWYFIKKIDRYFWSYIFTQFSFTQFKIGKQKRLSENY